VSLKWIDDRWHLDGEGIHAGERMEVCWPDGVWETVRIESGNCGRRLFAYFVYHSMSLCVKVADLDGNGEIRPLRWPKR